ncbi:MAG: hypothetical protein HS104_31390 [Polyangiaceae bacterium]|nr:hypothetical protein [Polyangiaceae bacterium]MCL4750740.1 hypothetical protein [Myxococcales bacterium]
MLLTRTPLQPLCLALLGLLACKQGAEGSAPSSTASAAAAPAASSAAPAAAASGQPGAAEVNTPELEAIAKEIVPKGIPTERSKPPSVAEWNAASEITVRHSGPLGCETKRVREWLRVSCRTSGSSGPQIQTVSIVEPKAKNPEYFTYEAKGVASIVLPLRESMDAKVAFTWSARGKRVLTATWPKGAPAPGIYFDAGAGAGESGAAPKTGKPRCEDVCNGARGFPSACETTPCPKNFKCLDNHICVCTLPCED